MGFRSSDHHYRTLRKDQTLLDFIIVEKVRWHFQAPVASWKGGHFKRLVGLVKSVLSSTLRKKRMTEADSFTIIKEVQTAINRRPLTHVEEEVDIATLTPNKLLFSLDIFLALILSNLWEDK